MITRSDAISFLLTQQRENARLAGEARERGGADHMAEMRAQKFDEIAKLLIDKMLAEEDCSIKAE